MTGVQTCALPIWIKTVNYNRDVEIFPVLNRLFEKILGSSPYKSPTDMGVNMAGHCIVDDEACAEASRHSSPPRVNRPTLTCDPRPGWRQPRKAAYDEAGASPRCCATDKPRPRRSDYFLRYSDFVAYTGSVVTWMPRERKMPSSTGPRMTDS